MVAEGVEDAVTRDLLVDAGCDELQGYYFSRPVSAERLDQWLRRNDVVTQVGRCGVTTA